MNGLLPVMGPRITVGRSIAGEPVTKLEALTDQSEWIVVWVTAAQHAELSQFVTVEVRDARPEIGVLGFIAQCGLCGQRAITVLQPEPETDWVCPRCAEIQDRSPYETGHDCGLGANAEAAAAMFPQHRSVRLLTNPGRTWTLGDDDDGPDLRKIRG